MKLNYQQALNRVTQAQGAWLIYGDEPLLQQNLLQAFRQHWQSQDIERQRFDIQNKNDWAIILENLNSLSLFSTQLAIEVHGNIKPEKPELERLRLFLQDPQGNILLMIFPKQDSKSLKSAFFQLIEANGMLVNLAVYQRQEQRDMLQCEADKLHVQLDEDAWQWLLYHHENNLLAARNNLMLLSDRYEPSTALTVEQLQACLIDYSHYTIYDLSDACLAGEFAHACKILDFLYQSGEPPNLIFWALQKDMRLLLQLFEHPGSAQQLGIWRNKIPLYQKALRRTSPQQLLTWSALLLTMDNTIKGVERRPVKGQLLQLVSAFCGQPLFPH